MARQLIEKYIFSPNAAGIGSLKFPGKVDLTQLLIIAKQTSMRLVILLRMVPSHTIQMTLRSLEILPSILSKWVQVQ
jgi:hypothetical protein